MKKGKSSLSAADSYKGIGEFWDDHDLADCWDQTSAASFEVEIESDTTYYAVEKKLAAGEGSRRIPCSTFGCKKSCMSRKSLERG